MATGTATGTAGRALLTAEQVDQLPWEDLHGVPGVRTRVLWRSGGSLAGLLLLEAGATIATHAHPSGHHHVHVESGHCRISGEVLDAGGYAHIPAGQQHDMAAVGDQPCRLFYLYLGDG